MQNTTNNPATPKTNTTNPTTNTAKVEDISREIDNIADNTAVIIIFKIISAIIIFFALLYVSKKIAKLVKTKLITHYHLDNDTNNEKTANLISDIVFYTLLILSLFIGFEIL